jgi:hypothetical protein
VRSGFESEAAIDHWHQVSVRNRVEHVSGPGPVDAREDNVEIQQTDQAGGLTDAVFPCFKKWPGSRCSFAEYAASDMRL